MFKKGGQGPLPRRPAGCFSQRQLTSFCGHVKNGNIKSSRPRMHPLIRNDYHRQPLGEPLSLMGCPPPQYPEVTLREAPGNPFGSSMLLGGSLAMQRTPRGKRPLMMTCRRNRHGLSVTDKYPDVGCHGTLTACSDIDQCSKYLMRTNPPINNTAKTTVNIPKYFSMRSLTRGPKK